MLKIKKYKKILVLFSFVLIPNFVFAQNAPQDVNDLLYIFIEVLDFMVPLLIGLAVLLFLWGLLRYYSTDNQNTKKEAINIIGYGVISIFVMVSIWGLVNLIVDTFNLSSPINSNSNFPVNEIEI